MADIHELHADDDEDAEARVIREMDRAERVEALLEQTGAIDHLASFRAQLLEAMVGTRSDENDERYRLKIAVNVLDKVSGCIAEVLQTGELAKRQMQELRTGRKRFF